MNYDICLIGVKDTTIRLAEYIMKNVCKIDCIISIDSRRVNTENISGYQSISSFANENTIKLFEAPDYSLKDIESKRFFQRIHLA